MSRLSVYSSGLNCTGICTPVTVLVSRAFSRLMVLGPSGSELARALAPRQHTLVELAQHVVGDARKFERRQHDRLAGRRLRRPAGRTSGRTPRRGRHRLAGRRSFKACPLWRLWTHERHRHSRKHERSLAARRRRETHHRWRRCRPGRLRHAVHRHRHGAFQHAQRSPLEPGAARAACALRPANRSARAWADRCARGSPAPASTHAARACAGGAPLAHGAARAPPGRCAVRGATRRPATAAAPLSSVQQTPAAAPRSGAGAGAERACGRAWLTPRCRAGSARRSAPPSRGGRGVRDS